MRVLLITAHLTLGVYGFASSEQNWMNCDFVWAIVHVGINGTMLLRSLREYQQSRKIPAGFEEIYEQYFSALLSPVEFTAICQEAGDVTVLPAGLVVMTEGEMTQNVIFIIKGEARVIKGGEEISRVVRD
jgi:CRP-like cAMP-binding protein